MTRSTRLRRSVILTGASRGLGAALFTALYTRGDRVLAIARRFSAEQCDAASADPDAIRLRPTDLRDADDLPTTRELAEFLHAGPPGGEAVLVHNAAMIDPLGYPGALDPAEISAAVQVNLIAPMQLTNAFLATATRTSRVPRLVYITSSATQRPYPGWATYCATKAAAEIFMRCAEDPSGTPCTVDIVDPGAMDTDMQLTLREQGVGLPGHDRLVQRHAAAELADPQVVAGRIVETLFAETPFAEALLAETVPLAETLLAGRDHEVPSS